MFYDKRIKNRGHSIRVKERTLLSNLHYIANKNLILTDDKEELFENAIKKLDIFTLHFRSMSEKIQHEGTKKTETQRKNLN